MPSLRKLLPRTFTAFFHRFPRAREVQLRGVPPILEGRNVLLCAPTASGKTEAYAAPLAERLLAGKREPLGLLVVSPTRALANDLKRRLEAPMHNAGVSLGRYTGEHKERRSGAFPEAVLTTPEGLDSLLDRRPEALKGVKALVLDEIHVLDGTPRGDQLRILACRLDSLAGGGIQKVAASATVHDPRGMGARYGAGDVIVSVGGSGPIRARLFRGKGPGDVADHLDVLARAGFRKVLVFCNARNTVEFFSSRLKGRTLFKERIFSHHGSMAKGERERTEKFFLHAPAAVCLATMTLELGIDIGSVDYVLLLDVPPDVPSLLQRIGRGSRRAKASRVGYVCGDPGEAVLFRTLLERGAAGDLCRDPYAFRPSVLVQQALTAAGREGHVTADMLREILPRDLSDLFPGGVLERILEGAEEGGLLERAGGGRFVLSEKMDDLYVKGKLHSNISSGGTLTVVDRVTGDEVGEIGPWEGMDAGDFHLAGKERRPVRVEDDRVLTDKGETGDPARFKSRPKPFVSFRQGRAVAETLGIGGNRVEQRRMGAAWILFHGLGSAGGKFLASLVAKVHGKGTVLRDTAYTLRLRRPLEELPSFSPEDAGLFLAGREAWLTCHLGMGPYQKYLPQDLRLESLRGVSFLEGPLGFLAGADLRISPKEAPREWASL